LFKNHRSFVHLVTIGLVLGGSQALSRSLFSQLILKSKKAPDADTMFHRQRRYVTFWRNARFERSDLTSQPHEVVQSVPAVANWSPRWKTVDIGWLAEPLEIGTAAIGRVSLAHALVQLTE
jgi:hypothetical protein